MDSPVINEPSPVINDSGAARAAHVPSAAQRGMFLVILVALSQNLAVMDFAGANVSAASIMKAWAAQPVVVQWVLSIAQLTLGAFLIVGGRLADAFGQRRTYIAGSLIYAAGNLLAAVGPTLFIVIAGRAVGGIGIALFNTAMLSLATRSLPPGRERTLALAMFGVFTSVGGALGVVFGGAMVTLFGWRSVFLLNGSLGLLNLILALALLSPTPPPPRTGRATDVGGALLISMVSGLMIFSVMCTRIFGWFGLQTAASFALALAFLGLFIFVERSSSNPLVPLSVFARPGYARVMTVAFIGTVSAAGGTYLMSMFLQLGAGLAARTTGLMFIPKAVAALAIGAVLPRLLVRWSPRLSMVGGLFIQAIVYCLMARIDPRAPALPAILTLVAFAAGNITFVVAATGELTRSFSAGEQGLASGLLIMMVSLASAFSVAIDAAVLQPGHPGMPPHLVAGFLAGAGISAIAMLVAATRVDPPGQAASAA
jgi:MFS family permease